MFSRILLDLRHGVRGLARTMALSGAAVLCLALGIGATTAIYSAVNTALLQPLPFRDPANLVTVYRTTPHFNTGPFSAPNYTDLRQGTRTLESLAAVTGGVALLASGDESARISAYRVSDNMFETLGVRAVRGRLFATGDGEPDRPLVVVLSDELWRSRFGADPAILGQTIRLDGREHEVLGILPPRFRIPHGNSSFHSDAWVTLRFTENEAQARRSNFLMTLGRLRDNVSVEAADADMRSVMDGIVESFPQLRGEQLRVLPLQRESVRAVRGPLLLLLGAVGFVLWIAAANVASLLLARGVGRQREVAVRSVLGAGGWDVVRPALIESALLTLAGLGLGLGLAWTGVRAIGALAAARLPQLVGLGLNAGVLLFAVVISAVVAFVCGIAPAWQAGRSDPQEILRSGGRGGTGNRHHRFLRMIVAAEVALSLVLLLGAGLVLRGFERLAGEDPGFDPAPLLALNVNVPPENYPDRSAYQNFVLPAIEAVRAVPGVAAAGVMSAIPFESWGINFNMRYEGQAVADPTTLPLVESRTITPGYFEAMGIELRQGRVFTETEGLADNATAVVIANQALADRDFPGQDPIGKRFHTGDTTFATIVGIVANVRNMGPDRPTQAEVYWSRAFSDRGSTAVQLMVRVNGDALGYVDAVTRAIKSVDRLAAVSQVRPMTEVIAASIGRPRFYLMLLAVFAGAALLLATAGLYGVMSYAVAQRTREIGIRTALGSTRARTVGLIMRQGMKLVSGGVLLGLAGAVALTFVLGRLLASLLYGVSRWDGPTWLAVTLILASAAALAILLPARRASGIEPLVAMRED
jgi:predicted permease